MAFRATQIGGTRSLKTGSALRLTQKYCFSLCLSKEQTELVFFPLRTKNSEGCVQKQIRLECVCGVILHICLPGAYKSLHLAHSGGCDRSVCGASLMGVVAVGINLRLSEPHLLSASL